MRKFIPLILAGLLALVLAPSAFAKTYYPTRTGDPVPNGCKQHNCSLREAVNAASNHAGSDKIVLKGGKRYRLSRPGLTGSAGAGDLDVKDSGGAGLTILSSSKKLATVDAQHIDRAFLVWSRTTFKYLKITRGDVPGAGGGIYGFHGKVIISKSVVAGNRAVGGGGGIHSEAGASLYKSTVTRNTGGDGAGLYNTSQSDPRSLSISRSTIDNNRATNDGGGIYNSLAALKIVNSTVANNAAENYGGGLANYGLGTANLNAVTIARNLADSDNGGISGEGGGVFNNTPAGNFKLQNSLLARNSANGNLAPDCASNNDVTSLGHNMITDASFCDGLVGSDYVNGEASPVGLGFLAGNGGPTKTLSISKHSKARNNANGNAPSRDQRGHKRHNPDIGAFER